MKHVLALALAGVLPVLSLAVDAVAAEPADTIRPAEDAELADFQWLNRLVVVFADTPADPRFEEQMVLLTSRLDQLEERDVVVLFDTDPAAMSPIRQKLRPRGFMLVLMDKDGTVHLRKPFPWSVREITRSIDKMPLRQRELRDRLSGE